MAMNVVNLKIFKLPPYLFFSALGFMVAFSVFIIILFVKKKDFSKYLNIAAISLIGLYLGARFLGVVLNVIISIHNQYKIDFDTIGKTGIVFFGGLMSYLATFILYSKMTFKIIDYEVLDVVAFICPLFHAFGRMGCYTAGCCYGIVSTSPIAVKYTNYINGEITTAFRIPIQLIEAGVNCMIFLLIIILYRCGKFHGRRLNIYLITYSVCRFFIEFLRGDWDREVFTFISMSQTIAVVLIIINVVYLIRERKRDYGNI